MNNIYTHANDIEIVYPGNKTCPIWLGVEFWGNAWSQQKPILIIGEKRDGLCHDLLAYCVASIDSDSDTRRLIGYWTPASVVKKQTVITIEALLCHKNSRFRTYAAHLAKENENPKKKKRHSFEDLPI